MNNSISPEINEEIFESLLKIAAKDAMRREMDALPSLEELNKLYTPPESVNKKFYTAIDKKVRAAKVRKFIHSFAKAAAVFFVVVIVGFGALMSVEASRNFIINTFADIRDEYVLLDFMAQDEPVYVETAEFVLGYIPEGFEIYSSVRLSEFHIVIFTNELGDEIIIDHHLSSDITKGIDNERRDFSVITMNGNEAFFFQSRYYYARNQILWVYGNNVISISTTLCENELMRIAENFSLK